MEPRSAVFPAWAHSHTGVDRRLGPRRISLFMTLPPYTMAREGEVHELGLGGRNCSRRARSRPVKPQASAWNGKVQPLQPNDQLVAPPVGNAMTSDALWCRAMFSVRAQTTNQRRER